MADTNIGLCMDKKKRPSKPLKKSSAKRQKSPARKRGAKRTAHSKQRRDGKQLESLVKDIEARLLPAGFKVELNQGVRNDEGEPLAEFDLLISGTIGSSSINWLIECRDRPSQGPAPGSWIEQLAGRRSRFNFDKVMAVSTSGFAAGAKQYAEKAGIVLRTVTDISDLKDEFIVKSFHWTVHDFKVSRDLKFIDENGSQREHFAELDEAVQIRLPDMSDYKEVDEVVIRWFESHVIQPSEPSSIAIERWLEYRHPEWLGAIIRGTPCRIRDLIVPVILTAEAYQGRVVLVRQYAEGQRVIGQEGEFEADTPQGRVRGRVLVAVPQIGEPQISVEVPEDCPYFTTAFELLDIK